MQSESFKRRLVVAVKNGFQWSKIYLTGSIKNNGRDLFLKASSPIKSDKFNLPNLVSCHKLNKKLIGSLRNYFGISDFTSIFCLVNNTTSKALKNINSIQISSLNRLHFKSQILRKREMFCFSKKTETNYGKLKIIFNPKKKSLTKLDLNQNSQMKRNKNICHKKNVNHSNKLILNNDNKCNTKLEDTLGSKPFWFSYKTVSIIPKEETFKEKQNWDANTNEKEENETINDNNQESLKTTYMFHSPKYYFPNLKLDETIELSQKGDTNVEIPKAIDQCKDFLVDSGSSPRGGGNIENSKQDNGGISTVSKKCEKTVSGTEKKIEDCLWFESKYSEIDNKQKILDSINNSRVNIKFVGVRESISDKLTEDIFDYTNKESSSKIDEFEKEFISSLNLTDNRKLSSADLNAEINSIKVTKGNINQSSSKTFEIIEKHNRNNIENYKRLQSKTFKYVNIADYDENSLKSNESKVNVKKNSENMEKTLSENLPKLDTIPERVIVLKGSEITHLPSANSLMCENNPKNTSFPNKINDIIKIAIGKTFPVLVNKEVSDKTKESDKIFNSNANNLNCTVDVMAKKKEISPLVSPTSSDKKFTTFFFDFSEMSEISNNVSNALDNQIQCSTSTLNDLEDPSQQEKSLTLEPDEFGFNLQKLDQTEVVNYFINRNKQMPNRWKDAVKLTINTELEKQESMKESDKFRIYLLRPAEMAALSEALIWKQETEFQELQTGKDLKCTKNLQNENKDCLETADSSGNLDESGNKTSQIFFNACDEFSELTPNDNIETIKKITESDAENSTETNNIKISFQSNFLTSDHALNKMKTKIANSQSTESEKKEFLPSNKQDSFITNKSLSTQLAPTEKETYYFPSSTHLTELVSELQGKMLQYVKSDVYNASAGADQNNDLNNLNLKKLDIFSIGRNQNQKTELSNVSIRRKSIDKLEELKSEQTMKTKPLSRSIISEHKKTFRIFAKKFEKLGLYKKKTCKIEFKKSNPLDQRIPKTKSTVNLNLQPNFQNTPEGKRLQKCFLNLRNKLTAEMKLEKKVYKGNNKFIFKKIGKIISETSPSKYSFDRKNTGESSF